MKILNKAAILGPMVRRPRRSRPLALPAARRSQLECRFFSGPQETTVQHLQAERRMLQKIRHPYVVGLRHAFQTREKLYMVHHRHAP